MGRAHRRDGVAAPANASTDEDELRAHVHDHLGSLKTPETIAIRDEVPQTATGKILRRAVREELS